MPQYIEDYLIPDGEKASAFFQELLERLVFDPKTSPARLQKIMELRDLAREAERIEAGMYKTPPAGKQPEN